MRKAGCTGVLNRVLESRRARVRERFIRGPWLRHTAVMGTRHRTASPHHATIARLFRRAGIGFVRNYHRLTVEVDAPIPDEPCLVVANHGFGGLVDLNAYATLTALDENTDRPVTILVHQMAWTFGAGSFVESVGGRPASHDEARESIRAGHHVLVFPGGDLDGAKPFAERNKIKLGDRTGFARLAISERVPIVPIVSAGAGESLLVLSDGQALAKALGLRRLLRSDVMPVSCAVPWGLNAGVAGLVGYLPLPSKLDTAILAPIRVLPGEEPVGLAASVGARMQQRLDVLTQGRRPVVGRPHDPAMGRVTTTQGPP